MPGFLNALSVRIKNNFQLYTDFVWVIGISVMIVVSPKAISAQPALTASKPTNAPTLYQSYFQHEFLRIVKTDAVAAVTETQAFLEKNPTITTRDRTRLYINMAEAIYNVATEENREQNTKGSSEQIAVFVSE